MLIAAVSLMAFLNSASLSCVIGPFQKDLGLCVGPVIGFHLFRGVDKFQDDSTINIPRLLAINTPHDCIPLPHRQVFHRVAGLVLRRVETRRTPHPVIVV